MKLAVVIASYRRPDGKTPVYLEKTLLAIDRQTHRDYRVFVVGDAYDPECELSNIVSAHSQTVCYNLDRSPERERYGFGNMKIWCAGGVTAVNMGIDMALSQGFDYICHQAHDDIWDTNHLAAINEMVEEHHPIFCCTLSTYGKNILPPYPNNGSIISYYPIDGGMIASSACVKYSDTKIRPMDRLHEEGIMSPCDAYLWEQLRNEMKATSKQGYLYCDITCHHDEEGYSMNSDQVQRHAKINKR